MGIEKDVAGKMSPFHDNTKNGREKNSWNRLPAENGRKSNNENRRQVGSRQETRVQDYLQKQGYEILARNFYTRQGEIDIIAKKDGYLVFVEVKYRTDERFGAPEEAVDYRKQKKIMGAARYYMYANRLPLDTPCRFDVAGVLGDEIRITENAFWA